LTSNALKYSQARPSHPKKIAKNAIAFLKEEYDGALYQAADVGSGTGISTGNLYGEFQSLVGIEASHAMVEQARESVVHGSVKFLCARAENLPLEANSTQLVLVEQYITLMPRNFTRRWIEFWFLRESSATTVSTSQLFHQVPTLRLVLL